MALLEGKVRDHCTQAAASAARMRSSSRRVWRRHRRQRRRRRPRDGTGSDASAADVVVRIVAAGGFAGGREPRLGRDRALGASAIVKRAVDTFGRADI
jgi:hypothetical protein